MNGLQRKRPERVDLRTEPKDYRKELWIQIATVVARAENCRDAYAPGTWANAALEAFDATFKEEKRSPSLNAFSSSPGP